MPRLFRTIGSPHEPVLTTETEGYVEVYLYYIAKKRILTVANRLDWS